MQVHPARGEMCCISILVDNKIGHSSTWNFLTTEVYVFATFKHKKWRLNNIKMALQGQVFLGLTVIMSVFNNHPKVFLFSELYLIYNHFIEIGKKDTSNSVVNLFLLINSCFEKYVYSFWK